MSGFSNAVVGGSGILKRIAIRSFNYVLGSTGWTINRDGSAEFNNLSLRGSFFGNKFIINSTGLFMYNGTPGVNNLLLTIIPSSVASANDPFGNQAFPGFATYSTSTNPYIAYWEYDGAFSVTCGTSQSNWTSTHTIYQISPTIVANIIQSLSIGTGGPVTAGSWTRIPSPFSNGWVSGGGGNDVNGIVYRLTNNGSVEIWLDIINPVAKVNSVVTTFSSPFIPQKNQKHEIAGTIAGAVWATLDTSGNLIMTGNTAANAEINGRVEFYLGTFPP